MKKVAVTIGIALLCTSCFAGPNSLEGVPGENGKVANGWNGLWDGMISPISFIVSLFNENVEVYNPNSSGWYPFGFVVGSGILFGGGGSSSSRKS
ncbi:MAG: hypothetical protein ACFB2W_00830 [Leptolyngbyaceae cyanobacterium]